YKNQAHVLIFMILNFVFSWNQVFLQTKYFFIIPHFDLCSKDNALLGIFFFLPQLRKRASRPPKGTGNPF
ncbi:hypothetical protein, partial [Angelakisella massiliensis]|uniref:hypothetical protein n=1 Tax=Angelakisella massiliensis TaxID=1871018 RepID=UPI0024B21F25